MIKSKLDLDRCPSFVSSRPDFGPKQIKESTDLVLGQHIYECHRGEKRISRTLLEVVSLPGEFILCEYLDGVAVGVETRCWYADFNIFPYYDDRWNHSNWLERVED